MNKNDLSQIYGKRFTVLGANGFIGTNLCLALLSAGGIVKGCGRSPQPRKELLDQIDWLQIDLSTSNFTLGAVAGADIVVHLVATLLPAASNSDKVRDINENLIGTLNILEGCKVAGVKKIVYASSGGTIYGSQKNIPINETALPNPISSYGILKNATEGYLNLYKYLYSLDYVALRFSNPYGPYQMPSNQGLIAATIGKALKNEAIHIWGDGSIIRDYIHINDVISAILQSISLVDPVAPRVYNIGTGIGRSVNDILDSIEVIHGKRLSVKYSSQRSVDVPINILDINLAKFFLEWKPMEQWPESLGQTYDWLKDVINDQK